MADISELYHQFIHCKKTQIKPSGVVRNIQEHIDRSVSDGELCELIYFLMDVIDNKDKALAKVKK